MTNAEDIERLGLKEGDTVVASTVAHDGIRREVGGLRVKGRPMEVSHSFLAIDPERFLPREQFDARIEKLENYLHSAKPGAGYDEVLIAGEPETRVEAKRRATGIPLGPGDWQRLADWAGKFGISPPRYNTQEHA